MASGFYLASWTLAKIGFADPSGIFVGFQYIF
jgi:hypothetical protein